MSEDEDEENKIVNLRGIAIISAIYRLIHNFVHSNKSVKIIVWKKNRSFSSTHELRVHGINVSDSRYSDKNL